MRVPSEIVEIASEQTAGQHGNHHGSTSWEPEKPHGGKAPASAWANAITYESAERLSEGRSIPADPDL